MSVLTYSLTTDIRVPELCLEEHNRGTKRVFLGNLDIDYIRPSFVGCIWRAWE